MSQEGRHPSHEIKGTVSRELGGRCVVLGVTASASIYRSLDTARSLVRRGADVRVVMTEEAARLVSPTLFHWAVGSKPVVHVGGDIEHVAMAKECSGMLIAPATYSSIAKLAHGIADNSVVLTAITMMGYGAPVAVVPAMHEGMERSPQYVENERKLREMGVLVIPPRVAEGAAKYPNPYLVARVFTSFVLRGLDLKGARILVTAGATRSWIDRVRFITNPSSGRMGVEIAIEAYSRGAQVDLVHGHVDVELPHFVNTYYAETTEDMAKAVETLTSKYEYDAVIGAAAPLDFSVRGFYNGKLSSDSSYTITMEPAPKVMRALARRPKVVVAFAADVASTLEELKESAIAKGEKYGADIVVANPVNVGEYGFASVYDKTIIVSVKDGQYLDLGLQRKEVIARYLVDEIARMLGLKSAAT